MSWATSITVRVVRVLDLAARPGGVLWSRLVDELEVSDRTLRRTVAAMRDAGVDLEERGIEEARRLVLKRGPFAAQGGARG